MLLRSWRLVQWCCSGIASEIQRRATKWPTSGWDLTRLLKSKTRGTTNCKTRPQRTFLQRWSMQVASNDTTNPLMSLNYPANDQKMQKQPPNQRGYHLVVGVCGVAMVRFTFSFLLTQLWWVQELDLREEDKLAIENGNFLNDRHMYAVQKLLRKQFPGPDGLQSTLLCQNGDFETVCNEGKLDVICNVDYPST